MADANPTAPNPSCAKRAALRLVRDMADACVVRLRRVQVALDVHGEVLNGYATQTPPGLDDKLDMLIAAAERDALEAEQAIEQLLQYVEDAPAFMEGWSDEAQALAYYLREADPSEPAGSVRARATAACLAHQARVAEAAAAQHETTEAEA